MVTTCDTEILDEFNYGSKPTVTSGVCLPLNEEKLFDFVYTLASTNNDQSAPNLVIMYGTVRF